MTSNQHGNGTTSTPIGHADAKQLVEFTIDRDDGAARGLERRDPTKCFACGAARGTCDCAAKEEASHYKDRRFDALRSMNGRLPRNQFAEANWDVARGVFDTRVLEERIGELALAGRPKFNIVVQADSGAGKSHLAMLALQRIAETMIPPFEIAKPIAVKHPEKFRTTETFFERIPQITSFRFVNAIELIAAVNEHPRFSGCASLLEECLDAWFLVLDDIGAEPSHPQMLRLMKHRQLYNLATMITTALPDVEAFDAIYGGSLRRCFFDKTSLFVRSLQ